jgi:hypothetical protein
VSRRRREDLTAERLLALKNGDGDGVKKSWAQIGKMLGYNPSYLAGIASGKPRSNIATLVEVDPRDYLSDLVPAMTDADVAAWNAAPYCLCGCREPTKREHSNRARVPRGAPRLFHRAHFARGEDAREASRAKLRDPQVRRRVTATRRARRRVQSGILGELLLEWRAAEPGRSFPQLAELSGVRQAYLYRYARDTGGWVDRSTMARLFVAIGEPLRPELAEALERWAKNQPVSDSATAVSV